VGKLQQPFPIYFLRFIKMNTTNTEKHIVVAGATGKQGGAVARHLLRAGFRVQALTRRPQQPPALELTRLGAQVVAADLEEPASLAAALAGAYGVFSVQNYWEKGVGYAGEIRQGRQLADAARAAGVVHYVQSTMAAASSFTGVRHFEAKAEVEKYIDSIGLPRTFIGTVYFMDNVLDPNMGGSLTFPVLAGSLQTHTPFQMVAVDDIGAVVARVFEQPQQFIGQRIDVAGDRLTVAQMKAAYTNASGRRPKGYRIPAWLMRMLNEEFAAQLAWSNQVGWLFGPEETRALVPDALSFEQFLRQHQVQNL
jgi:uncharacterized protein YbjT (DUF2867 family)